MEIHSNSHKMERQRKIAEESLLLEKSAIQYANENQKSKLKRLENNKAYMDYFTSCIKQNEIKRKEARHINNSEQYLGTLITNPSDSYDKFKNCFLRNRNFRDNYLDRNPLGREIISNITPYRDSSCKNDSTFFNQVTSRSIHLSNNKDSDYTKDFLYYKNKVLGYNGESHFTNEGKDVDKELRLSYNQRYNDYLLRVKEESELKAQELNKKALEERLREENRINYRNLTVCFIIL